MKNLVKITKKDQF